MRRPFPIAPMASCFALTGFAVSMVTGLTKGGDAITIIEGALFALIFCYVVGYFAGRAFVAIAREHLRDLEKDNPIEVASAPPSEFAPTNVAVLSLQEAEAA